MSSIKPYIDFLNSRLAELSITSEQNTFTRVWTSRVDEKNDATGKIETFERQNSRDYKIFDADEEGNIVIHYFDLHGQPYRWKKEDTKQTRDFTRKRMVNEETGNIPAGSGQPKFSFFNTSLIKKINGKAEIETLYLVEGEFKAFKGYLCGLDIVGLLGHTQFL